MVFLKLVTILAWCKECGLGGYSEVSGGGHGGLNAGVPGADPEVQERTVHLSIHLQCVHVGLINHKCWMSDHFPHEGLRGVSLSRFGLIKSIFYFIEFVTDAQTFSI